MVDEYVFSIKNYCIQEMQNLVDLQNLHICIQYIEYIFKL